MRAESGGKKILENVHFYTKTNLLYCPIPSAPKSQILWGEVFQKKARRATAASCFQVPTAQIAKTPKKTKRATCGGPIRRLVPAGGAERRPVPRRTLLQRRVNGTSKGTPEEGGGGTLVTYHRSKSSPLKLNSCSSVCLPFFIQKRGEITRRIHSALCATRPHTVRSGLSRFVG